MDGTLSLVLLLLFLWGLFSQRVERVELTAPAAFVLVGLVLATCLGSMDLDPPPGTVKSLAEICLTWILFTDAARLSFRVLRPDLGLYLRLLLIGLPLCIALGRSWHSVSFRASAPGQPCSWGPLSPPPTRRSGPR